MFEFFSQLMNPKSIIQLGGLAALLFVIFAETGLLIGFFLPGDSLVFIAGMVCVSMPGVLEVSLVNLILSMSLAAILGNVFGYWFGYKVGPPLFSRKDSLIFNKKYLEMTQKFYRQHGAKALILGRFLGYYVQKHL